MADARARLREILDETGICLLPGVASAFDALLAQRAGFAAVFSTGAGIANLHFGLPDLGLTGLGEVVEINRRIVEATELPVVADADTGYGNHLNVLRTVRELEAAGVAAIVLEDQVSPKRCGHFAGKQVVTPLEMEQKLAAATIARSDPRLVLVARTDAVAVSGIDDAIARANAYLRAGADVAFVEAPTSLEELARIPREVHGPCLVNVVEGGATPVLGASELERLGFKFALHANLALRVAGYAVREAFELLAREGSSDQSRARMLGWDERQEVVGITRWAALEDRVAAEAAGMAAATEPADAGG